MKVLVEIPKSREKDFEKYRFKNLIQNFFYNDFSSDLITMFDNASQVYTVTEFADRCKECGDKYGKLLKEKSCDWTPVSEPPKEHGQYLVTIEIKEDCSYVDKLSYSHNLYSIDRFDFAGEKRPGWYDYDSECGYYEVKNVTAWMPLPETYKAESESKQYANLAKSFVKGLQVGLLNESEDKDE